MKLNLDANTDKLRRDFINAPPKVKKHVRAWINRTALRTEREAKQFAKDRVDTGQTQSSINTKLGSMTATVRPTAEQAIFAHEGRKPGKMPPFQQGSSLNRWATKRNIDPFLLARSIGRKGVKPHRFMNMAYKKVKPSVNRDAEITLSKIVRAI